MKQLILTPKELIAIGFKKKTYSAGNWYLDEPVINGR